MDANVYKNIDDMWIATLHELLEFGDELDSRVGKCREMIGYSATLLNPEQNFLRNEERKLSSTYAAAELLWYLSQKREIDGIVKYAPRYAEFANDGIAHGAYGYRWANNKGFLMDDDDLSLSPNFSNQFDALIALLKDKPNTRQGVVAMWDSGDIVHSVDGERKDTPCTLCLQFLVRGGELNMVTYMRSNDAWLGLPYDVFCFTTVQKLVAIAIGAELGTYTHQVGSMHLYETNAMKAQSCVDMAPIYHEPDAGATAYMSALTPENAIEALCDPDNYWVRAETVGRACGLTIPAALGMLQTDMTPGNFMDDLVLCCWHKTVEGLSARDLVVNPVLRQALR